MDIATRGFWILPCLVLVLDVACLTTFQSPKVLPSRNITVGAGVSRWLGVGNDSSSVEGVSYALVTIRYGLGRRLDVGAKIMIPFFLSDDGLSGIIDLKYQLTQRVPYVSITAGIYYENGFLSNARRDRGVGYRLEILVGDDHVYAGLHFMSVYFARSKPLYLGGFQVGVSLGRKFRINPEVQVSFLPWPVISVGTAFRYLF